MNKIAVLDVETTHLYPEMGFIVEIGIVELNLETGENKILFNSLVKEHGFGEENNDAWIFENSDLRFEDVLNAPQLTDLMSQIQEILNNYRITAFNKSFDIGWMESRGFEIPFQLPCIMLTATPICQIPKTWGNPLDPYKWPSTQEAWDFFFPNTDYTETHRAADDAIHEAMIVFEIFNRNLFPITDL